MSVLDRLSALEAAATEAPWEAVVSDDDLALLVAARNALPALIAVARAAQAADRVYEGLRTDENDGEFALWSEDDLVAALHALRPALKALEATE